VVYQTPGKSQQFSTAENNNIRMSSSLDTAKLLEPLSEESPAGADLEYDPDFGELERLSQGTPERTMGDEVIAAEAPDWKTVATKAQELLQRTKDLRVVVHLTEAATRTQGLVALADGLSVIRGLLDNYWEIVYPSLDVDDGNDATERVNSIMPLADPDRLLGATRFATMVEVPVLGKFSYRDYLVASGDLSPRADETDPPEMAHIEAAFREVDLDALTATADAVAMAAEQIVAIEVKMTEHVGAASATDLGPLNDTLTNISKLFQEQLASRGVGVAPADSAGANGDAGGPINGIIRSRDDAMRVLDKVCDYYERHEPSSPVPLLLRRAQRLSTKGFMDILRDLTPAGVDQAETIGGANGSGGAQESAE
jgi:type VI secretion system protein ImpA